jgi:hypothetical protein
MAAMTLFGKAEIQAAKIADMELDDECILERSRVVSIAPARMPFVGLKGRYNKRWFVDIVTLPHNAVRKQMSELFTSLIAMNKMSLDLTEDDLQLFFRYLSVVVDFFKVVLEGEEAALYPHVSSERKKRGEDASRFLDMDYRMELKAELFAALDEAMKYRFTHSPSMETLNCVSQALDGFAKKTLDYFAEKEAALPKLLAKAIRGSREKTKFEGRLLNYMLEKPKGHQMVAILLQILFSADVRAEFIGRNFQRDEQKGAVEKALQEAEGGILALPRVFEEAAKKYERRFSIGTFIEHYGQDRDGEAKTEVIGQERQEAFMTGLVSG